MMPEAGPSLLTARDRAIVRALRDRCLRAGDPLHRALSAKLLSSAIIPGDDVPEDLVTLESRVAFRVDGGAEETRVIVQDERRHVVGRTLPLTNPRALAMLGLRVGASAIWDMPDGRSETVTVTRVAYQPEAAQRPAEDAKRQAGGLAALRIVHSGEPRRRQGGQT